MDNAFCYDTKMGRVTVVENGDAITHVYFGEVIPKDANIEETPLLKRAGKELKEYFEGKRKTFDLPLAPAGTEFLKKVWTALQDIPYGRTCTYKEIAESVGNPKACRAVGMANNRNPIPFIIPCHRVIGANGKLVGYAGGLEMKEKLITMEKENAED
jgi:methylated-DNA-[protein]-cysteine S-methyltransferase